MPQKEDSFSKAESPKPSKLTENTAYLEERYFTISAWILKRQFPGDNKNLLIFWQKSVYLYRGVFF